MGETISWAWASGKKHRSRGQTALATMSPCNLGTLPFSVLPFLNLSSPDCKKHRLRRRQLLWSFRVTFFLNRRSLIYIHLGMSIHVSFLRLNLPLLKFEGMGFCPYHPNGLVLTMCRQALCAESLALTSTSSCHQEKRQVHMGAQINLPCRFPSSLWDLVRA